MKWRLIFEPDDRFETTGGTSKGGMVVAIQKELGLPIKFIGLGEQPDDLQPFDAKQFAQALFEE